MEKGREGSELQKLSLSLLYTMNLLQWSSMVLIFGGKIKIKERQNFKWNQYTPIHGEIQTKRALCSGHTPRTPSLAGKLLCALKALVLACTASPAPNSSVWCLLLSFFSHIPSLRRPSLIILSIMDPHYCLLHYCIPCFIFLYSTQH